MASREVDALRRVSSHPGIISLRGAFFSDSTRQVFIVTDFVLGSHLFSHVVQRTVPLKEAEASHIVAQLSDAISFCHALGVVHRDLKLENVLVSTIDVRLVERQDSNGVSGWQTEELFSVMICDFGFAKSLEVDYGFCSRWERTRTPLGTVSYTAPEIPIERDEARPPAQTTSRCYYDAFKADAFSMGVLIFVMLCLGFPSKDAGENPHRFHKLWPALSGHAQFIIDGLLNVDPRKRLGILDLHNHPWVALAQADDNDEHFQRSVSKQIVLDKAEGELSTTKRAPEPRWNTGDQMQDPAQPGILGLCRALVHIQQERGMACWALAGTAGIGGISVWDQLQWHVQLTEKRISEAMALLDELVHSHRRLKPDVAEAHEADLGNLFAILAEARKQVFSVASFDDVFMLYSRACGTLIELVARLIETARPGCSEKLSRAARRYRLCSAAVEQLCRERALICGLRQVGPVSLENPEVVSGSSDQHGGRLPSNRLHRLAEVLGARKILLGAVVNSRFSDIVATSTGLLGALLGEGEPLLLGATEIAELELIEQRIFSGSGDDQVPTEVLYQTISRMINEIHSRIAIAIVEDMRLPNWAETVTRRLSPRRPTLRSTRSPLPQTTLPVPGACGCRDGLKRLLYRVADRQLEQKATSQEGKIADPRRELGEFPETQKRLAVENQGVAELKAQQGQKDGMIGSLRSRISQFWELPKMLSIRCVQSEKKEAEQNVRIAELEGRLAQAAEQAHEMVQQAAARKAELTALRQQALHDRAQEMLKPRIVSATTSVYEGPAVVQEAITKPFSSIPEEQPWSLTGEELAGA
jgi:hypothetical protein